MGLNMKKYFTRRVVALALLAALLAFGVLVACKNPIGDPEMGTITISVGGAPRAVYPPDDDILVDIIYELTLTGSTGTENHRLGRITTVSRAVTVAVGTWQLTLDAYYDGQLYATGKESVYVSSGSSNNVKITMNNAWPRAVGISATVLKQLDNLAIANAEGLNLGEAFEVIEADNNAYPTPQSKSVARAALLASIPVSYEGMRPNLTGLEFYVTWDNGMITVGGISELVTIPAVLGQADISASYDPTQSADNNYTGMKRTIMVYHPTNPAIKVSVDLPVVVPLARESYGSTPGGLLDAAATVTGSVDIFEDDEIPDLSTAALSLAYRDDFSLGEWDQNGDSTPIIVEETVKSFTLNSSYVFTDYYSEFESIESTNGVPSGATALPNGVDIDGRKVNILISRAAPGAAHGGSDNATVYRAVDIDNVYLIRSVEFAKAPDWSTIGDYPFYFQGKAPESAALLEAALFMARIELKVSYYGTILTKTRSTDFIRRANALGKAGIIGAPNFGNDLTADRFKDDWGEGTIGYYSFGYYGSFQYGNINPPQDGDMPNIVFDAAGNLPRLPIAAFDSGSGRLRIRDGIFGPGLNFVGRQTALNEMTDNEFSALQNTYEFVGTFTYNGVKTREVELIPAANWEKRWFNNGRDPFVNRDESPYIEVELSFFVPSNSGPALYRGEGSEDQIIRVLPSP